VEAYGRKIHKVHIHIHTLVALCCYDLLCTIPVLKIGGVKESRSWNSLYELSFLLSPSQVVTGRGSSGVIRSTSSSSCLFSPDILLWSATSRAYETYLGFKYTSTIFVLRADLERPLKGEVCWLVGCFGWWRAEEETICFSQEFTNLINFHSYPFPTTSRITGT
jgi:hypothetical protein